MGVGEDARRGWKMEVEATTGGEGQHCTKGETTRLLNSHFRPSNVVVYGCGFFLKKNSVVYRYC